MALPAATVEAKPQAFRFPRRPQVPPYSRILKRRILNLVIKIASFVISDEISSVRLNAV